MSQSGARQWRHECNCLEEVAEERYTQKWIRMHSQVSKNNHKYFISENRVNPGVTSDNLLFLLNRHGTVLVCNSCNSIKVETDDSIVPTKNEYGLFSKIQIPHDDVITTGPDHCHWFVYVIECEWKNQGDYGYEDWKFAASKASKRVYVGSTNELSRRIFEHRKHNEDGSVFTEKFPPKELLEVHYQKTEEKARAAEESIAKQLKEDYPTWFVWQN